MKTATLALFSLGALAAAAAPVDEVARRFQDPPAECRPWVYWFWLNGNLTEEGIAADLEAMHRAGIGGVLIMEVDQGAPPGPVAFMSDRWRQLFKHMVTQAARLGIEVNMNNDAGWNGSGGPWVPLDKAMQVVVASETKLAGGAKVAIDLPQPPAKGGHYRDIAVLAFPTPADHAAAARRIDNLPAKAMSWPGMHGGSLAANAPPELPPGTAVDRDKIVDLSSSTDAAGRLTWESPPPGNWTVVRFGHTFSGAMSHPAPATGAGPECDKLSKEGIEANYRGMIGRLVKDVGPLAGKVFAATHVDSWEVGAQNWTPRMREEFLRRRGYDPLPFLPVLTGRFVQGADVSERFLRDLRQTVSDLLAENYIGHLRQLANADGLRLSMEAYSTPANDQDVANHTEEPICEFWWPDGGGFYWSAKAMASVAHVNGLPVVGAEAFTANDRERWLAHPAAIKALGDRAFCDGVNRFIVHRYAMQPWTGNRWPGMTMGPWGVHYERTNTWWEDSREWHRYVSRCQYLLRQGRFVADVLVLQSEEPMRRFSGVALAGHDHDGISPQAFLKEVTVRDGHLELRSGMRYRLLVLPADDSMSPEILGQVAALVQAGATVVGKAPVKVPGLAGYPAADARLEARAKELWSDRGKQGAGRIVANRTAGEVLADLGVAPDFSADRPVRYLHRRLADAEIYFLANPGNQAVEANCRFRTTGKTPEFWFPDTGRIAPARVFGERGEVTWVPVRLDPSGSLFVVFRPGPPNPSQRIVSVRGDGKELLPAPDAAATPAPPDPTQSFTMVAWVKPAADIALPQESAAGIAALALERNDALYPPPGHEVWGEADAGAGFGAGRNGVCVCEHGAFHFPALLVCPARLDDWTHVAVVYRDGTPTLYLNGRFAKQGLHSERAVHGGVGVAHTREVKGFRGGLAGLRQFPSALSAEEVAKLAREGPPSTEAGGQPRLDPVEFTVSRPGRYTIRTADGQIRQLEVTGLPAPLVVGGPWEVSFAKGLGAPEKVVFDRLLSWSEHPQEGVRFFSGSAVYRNTFDYQPTRSADPALRHEAVLDLGQVAVMAEVKVNGRAAGLWWKPPYRAEVTGLLRPGRNELEIRVVNLPVNRMIGDESLPEDSERNPNGTLKRWPAWLSEGKPSPTGRFTFTSWRLWQRNEPLQESGLLGPVTLYSRARILPAQSNPPQGQEKSNE